MPDLKGKGPGGLNLASASEASALLAAGKATSVGLVEACLARIAARDPAVRAWAHLDHEAVLAQARARDAEPRRGPLHGIPVGIKDIFDTYDMPTAYGSQIHQGFQPHADTAVVGLLRMAGAVILGKCVTTEFASPVPRETRNPHDPERSPGVSSSGSAAAVADYQVPLSLGSQTGGSTILPASFCGVVGYKASLTGIDRGGIRHLRPTLDTMGLFARTLDDIALLRAALVGHEAPAAARRIEAPPRVGVCRSINWSQAEPGMKTAFEDAAARLERAGAVLVDAEMSDVFAGIETSFRVISTVEGTRALGEEIARHLASLNHYIRSAHEQAKVNDQAAYDKAQQHALACRRSLAETFGRCDVLITPSAAGEAVADLTSVSNSAFNRIWTLMHTPAVSLPVANGPNGMPLGLQVVGPAGADDRTIATAQWIADRLTAGRAG
jgi:Asp-tRNA(Asn)/Glu-tRNA(Gln) amidotransferase A subunit family amidase